MLPVILALITGNIGNIIKKMKMSRRFSEKRSFPESKLHFQTFSQKSALYLYKKSDYLIELFIMWMYIIR